MRAFSPTPLLLRFALALGLFLTACTDDSEPVEAVSTPDPAPATDPTPAPPTPPVSPTETDAPDAGEGQAASAETVTAPSAPASPPAPRAAPEASGGVSMPLPPRPPMTAPERQPRAEEPPAPEPHPAPEPRDTSGADAFWTRFQASVRARDRAAIERGLAQTIRAGDQTFARSSEQVQSVIDAIVEEEAAREAYLAVESLTHGAEASTFESEVRYVVDGEGYTVVVFGSVAEVAPGDWRLVEVGSR